MIRIRKNVGPHKLLFGVGLSAAIGALILLASCSTNNNAGGVGVGPSTLPPGSCATPQENCPCDTTTTVECGAAITGPNNFIMCQHGTRSCTNGRWGTCVTDNLISAKSLGPLKVVNGLVTKGLGGAQQCSTGAVGDGGGGTTVTYPSSGLPACAASAPGAGVDCDCTGAGSTCGVSLDMNTNSKAIGRAGKTATFNVDHNSGTAEFDCESGSTCNANVDHTGTFLMQCESGATCNATIDHVNLCEITCPAGSTCNLDIDHTDNCTLNCATGACHVSRCDHSTCSPVETAVPGDPCDPYCNVFADDGNGIGGDGGDDSGLVAVDGGAVRAAGCGDGHLQGTEECDDGNLVSGDGCSQVCALELDFICPIQGQPCVHTNCGNGIREGGEECDDGNNQPYDGCSADCEIEPVCPPGGCQPRCGDGLKFPTEDCDDGNTRNGDGCDSHCHIESGATCTTTTGTAPSAIDVPIVYRDFKGADQTGGNPDFEKNPICGSALGIMANNLNGSQRPVFNTSYTGPCVTSSSSFNEWYSNAADNKTITSTLHLGLISPSPATYQFASNSFFPLDGNPNGYGDYETYGHDFGFTSELRFPFTYAGGEQLTFVGDDDVFVFINDKLAVDLGGVHGAETGTIKLSETSNNRTQNGTTSTVDVTGGGGLNLNVGTTYQIVVFQAERHTTGSNYTLTLSGFDHTTSTCTAAEQRTTLYRDYCATSDPTDPCPPDSEVVCPAGTKVVWQLFQWEARVPGTTTIDFQAATASDITTLPTAPPGLPTSVPIGTANATNSPSTGAETWQNLTDASNKPVPVSAQLAANNQKSLKYLRVYMTFVTTGGDSPQLDAWHQYFDCVPDQ